MKLSCGETIWPPSNNAAELKNSLSLDGIRHFEFRWELMESGSWQLGMQSAVFSTGFRGQLRWSLRLGPSAGKSGFAPLFLCCEKFPQSEVKAKFIFKLNYLDAAHNLLRSYSSRKMNEYCVFKRGSKEASYGYTKFFTDVVSSLSYKKIIIDCHIDLCLEDTDTSERGAEKPIKVPRGTVIDDLLSVFTTREYTDFTITSGGVSFPVHKVILSARSPVFALMFRHDMREQRENHAEISDTTHEAVNEMLRFIYTDKVTGIDNVARDLLALAERYALDRLKGMCEESLRGSLSVENAVELLIHADLHRAERLKTRAIDFIIHQNVAVMDTPDYKSMITSHPHLIAEILGATLKFVPSNVQ